MEAAEIKAGKENKVATVDLEILLNINQMARLGAGWQYIHYRTIFKE